MTRVVHNGIIWEERNGVFGPYPESGGAKIAWAPHPGSAEAFLNCPVYEALLSGSRGTGKSDTLLMDFAQEVGKGWGNEWKGIIFRHTFPQLRDMIDKSLKWFTLMFPDAVYNKGKYEWTFRDGESLMFRSASRPEDYWNYHGYNVTWLGFEELTTWPDLRLYTQMFSIVRSAVPGIPMRVRSTTNPSGPGHGVVKRRFALPIPPGKTIGRVVQEPEQPARVALRSTLRENLTLMESDPLYEQRIRASANGDPNKIAAWIDGSWDITSGGMFDDLWDANHHIVRRFNIPSSWYLDRSFDWGSSAPFSVNWFAESDGTDYIDYKGERQRTVRGDLFLFKEWYGFDGNEDQPKGLYMLAKDIAEGIVRRELDWEIYGKVKPGPADSSIYNVENGVSIAQDMGRRVKIDGRLYKGVHWQHADKRPGSRVTGWEMMRKMLGQAKPNKDGSPREHPGLFVSEDCPQFIRTVPSIGRDEKKPDDVDTDAEDHICFAADTMVLTEEGPKPIQDVPAGWIPTLLGIQGCTESMETRVSETVTVTFEDGSTVTCTPDHEFLMRCTWCRADLLKGRYVRTLDGFLRATDVQEAEAQPVYCLSSDAGHFALANKVIVSNCDAVRYRVRNCGKRAKIRQATGNY